MADPIEIKLVGIEPLVKQLIELGKLSSVKAALKAAALHIKGKVSKYPPSTIANQPGNPTGRWYQRGYGPRWQTRAGVSGRKTSETLGRKWATTFQDNDLTAVLDNNASYAPYVHDQDTQASFHQDRGWKTVQEVAQEEEKTVQQFIENYIRAEIAKGPK